ncbi:hypothetical protein BDU57DRAFT_514303 [Ampelomyces quisqualis]|uniref:WD40-repeat-containing domain protein n=1 Tax=Ampelomyces quisqualis TaxID=50730 RepID=A0A6A5QQ83_AMPQU|nr:hypothetical protein BDU57DRAFT_514303 [Ampelomyces quisqualis]
MNGQAIPGFYWDPEKKKYFKIQSATASRDANLKYSAQNIRKREKQERVQSIVSARKQRVRKERVARRHVHDVTQICVQREIGLNRRSNYAKCVWPDAILYGLSQRPQKVLDRLGAAPAPRFVRDPVSKTLYIQYGDDSIIRLRPYRDGDPPLPSRMLNPLHILYDMERDDGRITVYTPEVWEEIHRTTSAVSSLTYLPATGSLATTTYGSDRPPTVILSDPVRNGPYIGQQFTPRGCRTIWGAAARPTSFDHSPGLLNTVAASHVEHLAVAASNTMYLFTCPQTGAWHMETGITSLETDVLAVDWISYTTVALGCRDGKIRLYDTRSGGSSHILTHPFPISKIKRADDPTRLVVSGLQDSLFLYDIRSSRPAHPSGSNHDDHHYNPEFINSLYPGHRNSKKRRKMSQKASTHWSQPVLTFYHANVDDLELDVDVHPQLGLAAAAQNPDDDVAIRVSNLWTGKTVKEFRRDKESQSQRVRSLKFMDDVDGGVEIWSSWGGGIAKFTQ